MLRIVTSTSAAARLAAAARALTNRLPSQETLVIGASRGAAPADLARLLARIGEQRAHAGVDDRAALFAQAARAWRSGRVRWAGMPVVLLDVTIDSRAERDFIAAIAAAAPDLLATVPDGD